MGDVRKIELWSNTWAEGIDALDSRRTDVILNSGTFRGWQAFEANA